MSDIAVTITLLALVAVIGLWLGSLKIKGVGLGIGGVLFGGIIVSHFTNQAGISLDSHTLHFIQEFGLILFVYTIGIQVGPGFFSSLRKTGLTLNAFAILIVLFGVLAVIALHKFAEVPLDIILGIYSGAVTNTPSLGAGQQILGELGVTGATETMGMAYAIAYPFGICGILLSMWLIRLIFRIKVEDEAHAFEASTGQEHTPLDTLVVRVTNHNLNGLHLSQVPGIEEQDVVCSHQERKGEVTIPNSDSEILLGDILHFVGDNNALKRIQLVIGEEIDAPTASLTEQLRMERVVVTNEKILGKRIHTLGLQKKYGVRITHLNRSGVEFIPSEDSTIQFGDVLLLVGREDVLEQAISVIGNVRQKLLHVQMLPVFIGIGLGVMLGSIPFYIPGFPVALKLGLAGGPLVVALILARIGSIGKLHWFMPPSANLALRELGIVLFLSVVGFKSGANFLHTLINGNGLEWMIYGAIITFIPLMLVAIMARLYSKMNYLTLCGLLAGAMTDPPALAFANAIKEESGAAALSYATVYPLVMFLRIISPQVLAILLWGMG